MNILMSLMQLDIGGAETHVVELAKELKRRGHNIIVTSRGGAYEKELSENGIKHYCVPLNTKKPKEVITAHKRLKDIITKEKIDIVHAHARIPAFILGRLKKSMKFPFVTTAHWIFTTKYGLKYITNWGEQTLAVSEDIKKYLLDNYKLPEEQITVTVNGIDTQKFSASIDKTEVCRELDIAPEDNTVVYVSRMDEDRSLVAHHLIEAVEKLYPIVDRLKCIIVGGGNDFDKVKDEADAVNERLGTEVIKLTGARTDINRLIAPAKLFVGVSRAALEAMAAKKPVIVAGNEGYMGLFCEDKLAEGLSTNFCCRGLKESTTELLAQDIGGFFGLWEEEQEKLGEYGHSVVCEHYSIKRMADDAEKVYKKAMEG